MKPSVLTPIPPKSVRRVSRLKDPFSSLSHLIFAVISLIAGIPLIIRAFLMSGLINGLSMLLFVFGLVGLYTASGIYHALDISATVNKRLRKLDHAMIYVLIAGSYSPVCLNVLDSEIGLPLILIVWGLALLGILMALFWITCPKWLSASIYILMGWLCIFSIKEIVAALPTGAFVWLLVGGIIYTIGGVIYALKLPLFNFRKGFGNHELFHLFCIGGSFCHYMTMLLYVSAM
ncbi:MAG: hemolysin III family protein [Lachnospiraceae bacterium]|nr:hemolysin III family protein [Lachnospiraceae bacterium]